jgi:hypothetical protein
VRAIFIFASTVGLAACASEHREGNAPLSRFSDVQQQIESYYGLNATEEDWTCDEVRMDDIDESRVVGETATQVKLAVGYHFSSFDERPSEDGTCTVPGCGVTGRA